MAMIKGTAGGFVHECQYRCNAKYHASNLAAAIAKTTLSDEKVAAYLKWCCLRYAQALDANGRTLVHMTAAIGRLKLLKFLLSQNVVNINSKDYESNYTPLHYSLYYGQLHCAVRLIQWGANVREQDFDGLTPLDHTMKDRPDILKYDEKQPCEVYVWGTNTYFNLGLESHNSRSSPEVLNYFRKEDVSVRHVSMNKFHSIFVGSDGKVWSCGLGSGGRLGLGDATPTLVPKLLKIGKSSIVHCKTASAGLNHTILLMENGCVWTFGMNNYHQLGLFPPPSEIHTPTLVKSLRGLDVKGISASRFHSAFWTESKLFTCGLHGGQLGHIKSNEVSIITPKCVTLLELEHRIQHVATSDGATVLVNSKNYIYLFYNYLYKKLKPCFGVIKKICVIGGHLDHKISSDSPQEKGDDLKVLILTVDNTIYIWKEVNNHLIHYIISVRRTITITDIIFNRVSLILTTSDGEAFLGEINEKKSKLPPKTSEIIQSNSKFQLSSIFNEIECHYVHMKRIPHIHRAVSAASDSKGRNFAIIQVNPKVGLLKLPLIASTEMKQNMKILLASANEFDSIHDVVFEVGGNRFPAHRYIVSYSCEVLRKLLESSESQKNCPFVKIDGVQHQIFEQILYYLYTGDCDLLHVGICPISYEFPESEATDIRPEQSQETNDLYNISAFEYHKLQRSHKKNNQLTNKFKSKDPIEALREAAKKFGITSLVKALELLCYNKGYICKVKNDIMPLSTPKYKPTALENLWDISLQDEDGIILKVHKCILVSRLEYFNCMLSHEWLESSSKGPSKISMPTHILKVFIDYLYTDEAPEVINSGDINLAVHILVIADQFFCTRLKEIAEASLTNLLTLKNAGEMLQLAVTYRANQLKETVMEFICLNLSAILESRALEILDDIILEDLKNFYCTWSEFMPRRIIPINTSEINDELVNEIYKSEPVSLEKVEESLEPITAVKTVKKKQKRKRNSVSERIRNSSLSSVTSDEDFNFTVNKFSNQRDTFKEDTWIKVTNSRVKQNWKNSIKPKTQSPSIPSKLTSLESNVPLTPQLNSSINIMRSPLVQKSDESNSSNNLNLSISSPEEFPALGVLPSEKKTVIGLKSSGEGFKKFVKLSQKERKKIGNRANQIIQESTQSVKNAWSDPKIASYLTSDLSKKDKDSKESFISSTSTWQTITCSSSSISAIMAAEKHQRVLISKMKSKSLEYTQMEDKAIDDLMLLYDISNITDERVTIRRADSLIVSPPLWVSGRR